MKFLLQLRPIIPRFQCVFLLAEHNICLHAVVGHRGDMFDVTIGFEYNTQLVQRVCTTLCACIQFNHHRFLRQTVLVFALFLFQFCILAPFVLLLLANEIPESLQLFFDGIAFRLVVILLVKRLFVVVNDALFGLLQTQDLLLSMLAHGIPSQPLLFQSLVLFLVLRVLHVVRCTRLCIGQDLFRRHKHRKLLIRIHIVWVFIGMFLQG
mmetsp:Transcript_18033/g.28514  ORF Transcript_18033/g.28514 Transcript_18033/m.28514 type:complete len:209 (-) Transcript_18033:112-738(-)